MDNIYIKVLNLMMLNLLILLYRNLYTNNLNYNIAVIYEFLLRKRRKYCNVTSSRMLLMMMMIKKKMRKLMMMRKYRVDSLDLRDKKMLELLLMIAEIMCIEV